MPPTGEILLVPILIGINAFFVAAEYAVVAIRPAQIQQMRLRGRTRSAAAMASLIERPAAAIGAIQVCITMTNLMLGWVGEPVMSRLIIAAVGPLAEALPENVFKGISTAFAFVVVTLLTVVFSELLPKALTIQHTMAVARWTAVPVLLIRRGVRPLVWTMNALANLATRPLGLGKLTDAEKPRSSAEELRILTAEAAADGVITPHERAVVLNALTLGARTAKQIMIPRVRVAYLDLTRSMDENRQVMNDYLYSRLPLCDGGLDHVIGVVHTKDFLSAYNEQGHSSVLSLIARPAVYAPENISLDRLLGVFHDNRTQLVFLVDEHGGVEGIVTLRDVVDELLGGLALPKEHHGPEAGRPSAAPHAVDGDMPLHELAERLGRPDWCQDADVVSVGGVIVQRLGRIPNPGESVVVEGVRLEVLESDGRAVRRVGVGPASVAADRETDAPTG